jgi:hypothetical protein
MVNGPATIMREIVETPENRSIACSAVWGESARHTKSRRGCSERVVTAGIVLLSLAKPSQKSQDLDVQWAEAMESNAKVNSNPHEANGDAVFLGEVNARKEREVPGKRERKRIAEGKHAGDKEDGSGKLRRRNQS